jgi:hypothetical protein
VCLLQEVKQELQRIHIDGCRFDERLNSKTEDAKRHTYTGLLKTYSNRSNPSGRAEEGRGHRWDPCEECIFFGQPDAGCRILGQRSYPFLG